MKKLTLDEFLYRSEKQHKNKYDYSLVNYQNVDAEVQIKCIKHNFIFSQTPYYHMRGFCRCPSCKIEKQKETFLKNFGVDNPMKDTNKQKQAIKTKKQKYNDDWNNTKKLRSTLLERYGVDWNSKIPEVFEKQQSRQRTNKSYSFPSGNTYNVQGYESMAIDLLLKEGYAEEDILLKNRPSITYQTYDSKLSLYHPDIILSKEKE